MREFIDCLQNDEVPKVGAKDGLMSLAIGIAAGVSMRENRAVEIPESMG